MSVRDSSWLLSWTVNRQPHFKKQPPDQTVVWFYALFTDKPGDYVKKSMRDCTGGDHQGVALSRGSPAERDRRDGRERRDDASATTPFITAFFLTRNGTDRPKVVPDGVKELRLHRPIRGVDARLYLYDGVLRANRHGGRVSAAEHRAWCSGGIRSIYDVRELIKSTAFLREREKISIPFFAKKYVEKTMIGRLLEEYGVI